MGIEGLLRALSPVTRQVHINEFKGQSCGIDGYAWLHRSAYSAAFELATGKPTTKYCDMPMRFLKQLIVFGITPTIIFDGAQLPMKKEEENRRGKKRNENRELGLQYLRAGDREKAYSLFAQSVRVTRTMVQTFLQTLKRESIRFVIAPYEADSQLAYMFQKKQIDFVISEDSDILLFTPNMRLLTKFNREKENGVGQYIDIQSNLPSKPSTKNDFVKYLRKFKSHRDLVLCCVMSGCDYLDSIKGVGLMTAAKLVVEYRGNIKRLLSAMRAKYKGRMPTDYAVQVYRAMLAFECQRVFDTSTRQLTFLTPPHTNDLLTSYREQLTKFRTAQQQKVDESNNNRSLQVAPTSRDKKKKASRYQEHERQLLMDEMDEIEAIEESPDIEHDCNRTNATIPVIERTKFKADKNQNVNKFDDSLDFLGPEMDNKTATAIAEGRMDPRKKTMLHSLDQIHSKPSSPHRSLSASAPPTRERPPQFTFNTVSRSSTLPKRTNHSSVNALSRATARNNNPKPMGAGLSTVLSQYSFKSNDTTSVVSTIDENESDVTMTHSNRSHPSPPPHSPLQRLSTNRPLKGRKRRYSELDTIAMTNLIVSSPNNTDMNAKPLQRRRRISSSSTANHLTDVKFTSPTHKSPFSTKRNNTQSSTTDTNCGGDLFSDFYTPTIAPKNKKRRRRNTICESSILSHNTTTDIDKENTVENDSQISSSSNTSVDSSVNCNVGMASSMTDDCNSDNTTAIDDDAVSMLIYDTTEAEQLQIESQIAERSKHNNTKRIHDNTANDDCSNNPFACLEPQKYKKNLSLRERMDARSKPQQKTTTQQYKPKPFKAPRKIGKKTAKKKNEKSQTSIKNFFGS